MDRPVLHTLVERLRAEERLHQLAASLPTRARVSEPVLPLVLAALYEELGRGLVVLLAEDADARDAAEAAGWFIGDEAVALFPSRGVSWGSGLEPPPHLVGERARALEVLARGGHV
jgi:transcription-repair coupling factor (superfamily II helicase)